jgi:flavin reductase (DIM6/NTAB) family NADH-FMN oxidoreductase RutF
LPDNIHFYQPAQGHGLPHDPFNAVVAPRPIGWISSQDSEGKLNLAPYSFFNAFNYHPPIIGFASVGHKDTLKNIQATGEFCWSLVTRPLAEAMNQTSAALERDVDEFSLAGLSAKASKVVAVPHVDESPVSFECKLSQLLQLKAADGTKIDSWMIFGEVVGVHINKDLLVEGVYQTAAAEPVLRGGGPGDYFVVDEAKKFQLFRPQ